MENAVSNAGESAKIVVLIVMTVTLWILLHKYVTSFYFGGFRNMIMSIVLELFGCFIASTILVDFLGSAIGYIIGGVGSIFVFIIKLLILLLKIGLVGILIGAVCFIFYKIVHRKKYNNDKNEVYEENRVDLDSMMSYEPENDSDTNKEAVNEQSTALAVTAPDEMYCTSCGEVIKRNAKFCRNCGAPNEYGIRISQAEEKENSK